MTLRKFHRYSDIMVSSEDLRGFESRVVIKTLKSEKWVHRKIAKQNAASMRLFITVKMSQQMSVFGIV